MPKISPPGYTQVPNEVLDNQSKMTDPEFRVVVAICRRTFGWQKQKDRISLSQLEEDTGLSRQGVLNGIDRALKDDWIQREECRTERGKGYIYWPSMDPTSLPGRPVPVYAVDSPEAETPVSLVYPVDGQKKVNKLTKLKKGSSAGALHPLNARQAEQKRLIQLFSEITRIPIPNQDTSDFRVLWGGAMNSIITAANGNAETLMRLTIDKMLNSKPEPLTITSPKSIVKMLGAVSGELSRMGQSGLALPGEALKGNGSHAGRSDLHNMPPGIPPVVIPGSEEYR